MTIPEIKSTLSIQTVLASYGLTPGKGNSIKCPFHADGKASMKSTQQPTRPFASLVAAT